MRRRLFPNMIGDVVELEERQERMERVMQILGITPEYPYTVNINDGTRNRVMLGLVDGDYGIKIVDNAGNSILLANGTIVANAIKSGTLDCSLITVTNLDAGSITVGYLSASKIQGGTLNCGLMTVANLNAGSITVGSFSSPNDRFTDGTLSGVKISEDTLHANRIIAGTITSAKIDSRTINADRISVGTLTYYEIKNEGLRNQNFLNNDLQGAKIADATTSGGKIISSPYFSGQPSAPSVYASGGVCIGIPISYAGLALQAGYNIHWYNGEGNIENVNQIIGYNDLLLYTSGGNALYMYSTGGGGNLSFYPYWGDFYCTGTKYFRIPHPDNPEKQWLQYVSVEAPEVALKIRGIAQLNKGEATIALPHHWELVTEEHLTTVQLTPLEDCNGLFAPKSSLKNTSFAVKELLGGTSDVEFMWELTATRKGYSDFNPELKVDKEADMIAEDLAQAGQPTEEELQIIRLEHKKKRDAFRTLVAKKYKEKTGEVYKDPTHIEIQGKALKEGESIKTILSTENGIIRETEVKPNES